MTEATMRRYAVIIVSVGVCLWLGWPAAYTIAQNLFGEGGLNGGPGLTRPEGEAAPNDAPSADFSVAGTDSLEFTFTDASTDAQGDSTIVGWSWAFGDGTTSNTQNPSKTYAYYGGDRYVTLTVSDERGAQSAHVDTVYVRPGWLVADFDYSTTDSLTYTFWRTGGSSHAPVTVSWDWTLDDAVGDTFVTTFPAGLDSQQVRMQASVLAGGGQDALLSTTVIKWVPVADPPPPPAVNNAPVADIGTPSTSDNLTFTFDASGSTDSDGTIVIYSWTWGDGTSVSGATSTREKTYGYCGCDRTVILTVTDNDGASASDTATVQIAAPPSGTPAIASVAGTFTADETITITGSNFGTKGQAAPLIYESWESGVSGEYINQHQAAWANSYTSTTGSAYSNLDAVNGSLSVRHSTASESWGDNFRTFAPSETIFASYWLKLTDVDYNEDVTMKFARVSSNATASDPYGDNGSFGIASGNPCCTASCSVCSSFMFYYVNNTGGYTGALPGSYLNWVDDEWMRIDMEIVLADVGQSNGRFDARVIGLDSDTNENVANRSASFQLTEFWTGMSAAKSGAGEAITFWLDDVYVDNTWARVELTNNADYVLSTVRVLQVPLTWGTSEITATLKPGPFTNGQTAYVHVITGDYAISSGEAIQIGSTGGEITAPSILSIAANDTTPTTDQSVSFSASLSGSAPTSYTWRWGDGTAVGTSPTPSHTFATPGTYDITLIVSNSAGTDSTTRANYITASTPSNPIPTISTFAIASTDSLANVVFNIDAADTAPGSVDSLLFTPFVGGQTRRVAFNDANPDTLHFDYTSRQQATEQTETASVRAKDDEGALSNASQVSVVVKGSGGGGNLYEQGFEDGPPMPTGWTGYDLSVAPGFRNVSDSVTNVSSRTGTYHIRLEPNVTSGYGWDVALDLDGVTNARLTFWENQFGGSTAFNSINSVRLSVDNGSTWFSRGMPYESSPSGTWVGHSVDLDSLATANSVSLSDSTIIRFVRAGLGGGDVWALDDIVIAPDTP